MNSPQVIAKISTATVINPLVIRGRTTRHNTTTPLAPSTTAASSSSRGMFKKKGEGATLRVAAEVRRQPGLAQGSN